MGLVDEAVFVAVNVYDHLKGDGPVAVCSANAQVAEYTVEI